MTISDRPVRALHRHQRSSQQARILGWKPALRSTHMSTRRRLIRKPLELRDERCEFHPLPRAEQSHRSERGRLLLALA